MTVDPVGPVFPMMFVAAFVMQPAFRIPLDLFFFGDRGAETFKIFHGRKEFARREFGQIMRQSLEDHAAFEAGEHHQMTVPQYRFQMSEKSSDEVFFFHVRNYTSIRTKSLSYRKAHDQ